MQIHYDGIIQVRKLYYIVTLFETVKILLIVLKFENNLVDCYR